MSNHYGQMLMETGIVIIPDLLTPHQLKSMQLNFRARLKRLRWSDVDGYEKTEPYRHMVQNILTLDQGFVDAALHPVVLDVLHEYLGGTFELVEAKGWKSLPTKRDFHGWHGDIWYDQNLVRDKIPREIKLGIFLTDVRTGGFVYLKGTHGKHHPKALNREEAQRLPFESAVEVSGPAGLAFLFDTSGVHRQSIPILEPREAIFLTYHDPAIPLQREDVKYYRYHPLELNAAFLGHLSREDQRILGFGNTSNFQPAFERTPVHPHFQTLVGRTFDTRLLLGELQERIRAKLGIGRR